MTRHPWVVATVLLVAHTAGPGGAHGDEFRRDLDQHVVQDGETLSSIAARHYGNPHLWPALYRANRDQIKDPAHLYPGQSLRVPPVSSTHKMVKSPAAEAARGSTAPPRRGRR